MVAVTVIIAAVIGSAALGLGDEIGDSPPQATFEITEVQEVEMPDGRDGSSTFGDGRTKKYRLVTITHKGGEDVDPEDLAVTIGGEPALATHVPLKDPPGPDIYEDEISQDRHEVLLPWDSAGETVSAGGQLPRGQVVRDAERLVITEIEDFRTTPRLVSGLPL